MALVLGVLFPANVAAAPRLVEPGETLSELAEEYGLPVADLVAANGLADPDLIIAGTTLTIPDGVTGGSGVVPADGATYRVEPGDTLEWIAEGFGTSVAALLAANPAIDDPDLLVPGELLIIPPASEPIAGLLREAATRYGLNPDFVAAVAWQESGWRQAAVSPAGAIGTMQILPATGAYIAETIVGAPLDIAGSAADNITAGTAFLAYLVDLTGDGDLALAYYFQGQGNVARDGIYPETRAYIASVRSIQRYIAANGVPPR